METPNSKLQNCKLLHSVTPKSELLKNHCLTIAYCSIVWLVCLNH